MNDAKLDIKTIILEIIKVVSDGNNKELTEAYTGPGVLINSNFLNGLEAPDKSILETIKILEEKKFYYLKIKKPDH